jgi:hypothetical protein
MELLFEFFYFYYLLITIYLELFVHFGLERFGRMGCKVTEIFFKSFYLLTSRQPGCLTVYFQTKISI